MKFITILNSCERIYTLTKNNPATLTTIAGPMYAGKTSALLQSILWETHCNHKVLVLKPSIDQRYSVTRIETHNKLSFPCHTMTDWSEALDKFNFKPYNYHSVYLDEVQFMDPIETVMNVQKILAAGVNVVTSGLDQDSRGQPFETTALLLAISDHVKKIQAVCTICGQAATKTQRLTDSTNRVIVGSTGMYEPRCTQHWSPK